MTIPYWVQDAIFYQIFPDRFANSDPTRKPGKFAKWGSPPTTFDFQGGDLRGIIHNFDYLLDLGVTALYLNPIFSATSTHRYNTTDYYKIDPRLGDMRDFQALLDVAHRNNVKIVLDGVFNHTGRGFFAFLDVLENGHHSVYKDWFHIHKMPLEAYGPGEATHYNGWWGHKSLPKLNTANKDVRNYIMGVARYWIEQGADGWRLDVPNEIDDDDFWAEFRQVVKNANHDAYLLGEIWDLNPRWANATHFDGVMNYPIKDALNNLLGHSSKISTFADRVEGVFKAYPRENAYAMYVPLDSHDTERFLTLMRGDLARLKLAWMFVMAYPGAPAVYYGDEVGLEGGKDPDSRRAFPWDAAEWKADLHPWMREMISIRKARPSMRRGDYARLMVDDASGAYVFARTLGDEKTLIAMNTSSERRNLQIPTPTLWRDGQTVRNLLDGRPFTPAEGRLEVTLEPLSAIYVG
jgi:glycosidase